jgi:hypothetical protein
MRIVDHDNHVVAVDVASLQAPRCTRLDADASGRPPQVQVERVRDPHGDDDVLQVVRADEA